MEAARKKELKKISENRKKRIRIITKIVGVEIPEECIVKPATDNVTIQSINNINKFQNERYQEYSKSFDVLKEEKTQ